jgi:hypothetical protein
MAIVKQMNLEEAINFTYLPNFLMDRESVKHLQKILFVNDDKIQDYLQNINSLDLMIIFIYLNLITIRFEDKEKIKKCTKFNPNLVRIFLRYYPDLAAEFDYDLGSD